MRRDGNNMTDGPVPCHGFPVFSLPSVRLMAEQTGVMDVSDDVLLLISEDLTYRVREMISHSVQFMRHSGRTKMSLADVEKAFLFACIDPSGSYCHDQSEDMEFHNEEGIFFVQEKEVDLVAESDEIIEGNNSLHVQSHNSEPSLHWLAIDGKILSQSSDDVLMSQSVSKMTPILSNYCECIVKAIISNDPVESRVALQDLADNCRLQPIIGHILNALQARIKSPDLDFRTAINILIAFSQIMSNDSLLLSLPAHQNVLIESALDLISMPASSLIENDDILRSRAAALLSHLIDVCNNYPQIFDLDPKSCILNRLREIVTSFTDNWSAMSGVLITCLTCGVGDSSCDYLTLVTEALQVVGCTKECKLNLLHQFASVAGTLLSHLSDTGYSPQLMKQYQLFYESFGDSLICFLIPNETSYCCDEFRTKTQSLGWIEERTGEALLDTFYVDDVTPIGATTVSGRCCWEKRRQLSGESVVMKDENAVSSQSESALQRNQVAVCTIFENYAAFSRKKIKIIIATEQQASGESETAMASGWTDRNSDEVLVAAVEGRHVIRSSSNKKSRKEERERWPRNRRRQPFSCILINCFL